MESLDKVSRWVKLYKNWMTRVANHRVIADGKVIRMKLRNGLVFDIEANSDDDAVIEELFIEQPYTKPCGYEIKPKDIILDVGAHRGIFSVFALEKGAEVYAYEPHPRNYAFLTRNITLNYAGHKIPKAFWAYKLALSDYHGTDVLYESSGSGSHSTVMPTNIEHDIDTSTLDLEMIRLKLKKIDLLKLDCEGSEYKILYSSRLLRIVKRIAMEWHDIPGDDVIELREYLFKEGFKCWIVNNYMYAVR